MNDKELRRLSRKELLTLMLEQSMRIEALEKEVDDLKAQLKSRRLVAERAGSIAEAALQLSGVFEAAQQAADIYLENIKNMEKLEI